MASAARTVAINVILQVAQQPDAFSAEVLGEQLHKAQLSDVDARLATSLVYHTLRRHTWLDYQYRPLLKSAGSLPFKVQWLLRLAACQKFLLDKIPVHAISNETTELAKQHLNLPAGQVALVHAVVRKLVALSQATEPDYVSVRERLQLTHGFGADVADMFLTTYDESSALQLAEALDQVPVSCIRNNRLRGTREELQEQLATHGLIMKPGQLSDDSLILETGNLRDLLRTPEFQDGRFYIQDESSQLVAIIADVQPGQSVLDYCAAPGGKTTHLAERSMGTVNVIATDSSNERLLLLRENVNRLHTPGIEIIAKQSLPQDELYDLVLVDAPCSGLGTIRHNPELRWRVTWNQVEQLSNLQRDILLEAAQKVKPGGVLVYSTCTITRKENEAVIGMFLRSQPGFEIDTTSRISGLKMTDGFHKTWPSSPMMDGFVVTRLNRVAQI